MWGMGMDCSVKLSTIGVFQHENKSLGTSGCVQIHFSISRYSWSLSETRTCILSSCMTPKLLMLLYRGSCWPLAQSVCNCQCLSCSWNGWAQFHLVLWNTWAIVTTLDPPAFSMYPCAKPVTCNEMFCCVKAQESQWINPVSWLAPAA